MSSPRLRPLLAAILLLSLAAGCTEDPLTPAEPVTVIASGLPQLDQGLHYELWFSYPLGKASVGAAGGILPTREYISIGSFRVSSGGALTGLEGGEPTFTIPAAHNPTLFYDAVVTIQRDGDNGVGPIMLSGSITRGGGEAYVKLELKGESAFGGTIDDQTKRLGYVALDAPTTPEPGDFASGLWFIELRRDSLTKDSTIRRGIGMPSLPFVTDNDRWDYESWLVHRGGGTEEYISLGRFVNPGRPDSNGAGPGAGPAVAEAYGAPGEDFVAGTPRTLTDGNYGVLLSLQPRGFALSRPLVRLLHIDTIPAGAGRLDTIPLVRTLAAPLVEVTFVQQ